jgi:diguanylate cyclase (GGDEF)-like protein
MHAHDTPIDDLNALDTPEVARRLQRLADLERLIDERSDELSWVNERLVTELYGRSEVEAEASALARYDRVTGLPNRMSFEHRLASLLAAQSGDGQPAAVILIGLDKLAQVRDTLGFRAGDAAARAVADRLRLAVRGSDVIARIGDDTFALVLTQLRASDDAASVARKLHQALDAPLEIEREQLRMDPALGLALYPTDGVAGDVLIACADSAMRHARDRRSGFFQFFQPQRARQMARRLSIEAELRAALESRQFINHYQPRFNLKTGACVGAEALLRWNHPVRGLLAPADFLDVAESCGLIVPIGAQVLMQACNDAAHWGGRGVIAVNVSPREFRGTTLIESVRTALAASNLPAVRLQIEITEASLGPSGDSEPLPGETADPDVVASLAALRALGVRVALDDFGAGAASLSTLHAYDVDALKIDTSFVQRLPGDKRAATMVAAILHIAKRLRLRVVAEGIETAEQRAYLRRIGCLEGQGYWFARPQSTDEVAAVVAGGTASRGRRRR